MRYSKLDGLRGLLSVIVALNHSFMILTIPAFANIWGQNIFVFHDIQSKIQQLLMLVGNGGLAVSLFFVLSGFVLAESAKNWKFTPSETLTFYVKRFLRLYPVYLFLIIVSALYMWSGFTYKIFPAASPWFHWWMNFTMTIKELVLNATFIHTYLGGVTWTLRVILIASLFFPVMYYVSKRSSLLINLIFLFVLTFASFKALDFPNFNDLRFLYMFFLGMLLPRAKDWFSNISPKAIYLSAIPLLLVAFYFRYLFEIHLTGVVESAFSFLLLGILSFNQRTNIFGFLESKLCQFLGKISYSLYLVHFTVLYIVSRAVLEAVPSSFLTASYLFVHTALFITTTILAVVISLFVNKYIEAPAQALSRKVRL